MLKNNNNELVPFDHLHQKESIDVLAYSDNLGNGQKLSL